MIQHAEENPRPCLLCGSEQVIGIGTWIAGKAQRLAVGDKDKVASVFAFWLCDDHIGLTPENEKAITQAIIRQAQERPIRDI